MKKTGDRYLSLTVYPPKTQVKHQHALVRPDEVSRLLKDIHVYQGYIATSAALKLSPSVFTRPGDTRQILCVTDGVILTY